MSSAPIDTLCINTLRTLAIDAVQRADSGHPGLPLGAAPMAYVLFQRHLRVAAEDPTWADRDRFVLSAGHGSALLYALLHVYGFRLSLDDLKAFRQLGSKTPGHPEFGLTPGVDATTGPLGQGCSNAVGMAIAERTLAHRFNRPDFTLIDHYTYVLVGDGDMMEGISSEAASLAGHLGLGRLIYLYDANDVCLDGPTSMTFTEDVAARYAAYGWHVQTVADGDHDLDAIDAALTAAREDPRPSMIVVKTTIGFGSPNKAGTSGAHGSPLGKDEVRRTKEALGWPPDASFEIPKDAAAAFRERAAETRALHDVWQERLGAYRRAHPDLARELEAALGGRLIDGWDARLPVFAAGSSVATRVAGGKAINALAATIPTLIGGDADLSVSTKTAIDDGGAFDARTGAGRNIHFGVREHAMGAIANGMAYHGGVFPYTATFFAFTDYMRPAIRLAALNHLPVINVFTHDSIGLGEDGPTHQPVEQLMSLRCMPNVYVMRPSDANETCEAWRFALTRRNGPTALVLSRQNLPVMDRQRLGPAEGLRRGAYVLRDPDGTPPRAALLASGSEVALALAAADALEKDGVPVRVVAMPCWELFDAQDDAYKAEVLPDDLLPRVAVEAGVPFGWERYIGPRGRTVTVGKYGASAPAEAVFEAYGFTVPSVVAQVKAALAAPRGR